MMTSATTRLFITGTGTGIGKTLISAILAEAFKADYWKPVQAGCSGVTDSDWVKDMISNTITEVYPEVYKLQLAASPHIAAREENIEIDLDKIALRLPQDNRNLIIEGAGGLLVPLNSIEFVADLIKKLSVSVLLVSRNSLGSINHSLLTANECKRRNIPVLGWIFNDHYLDYEDEIVNWSGFPRIASIPFCKYPDKKFISEQAAEIMKRRGNCLC